MFYYHHHYHNKIIGIMSVCAGVFALGFAWLLEHIWYYSPCEMCLLERWPYRFLILFGICCYLSKSRWFLNIIIMILLISVGLSITHIGIEQGWWSSPLPECHSQLDMSKNIETQFLNLPDRPSKPCDLPAYLFKFIPISLTMMNGLYSLGLLLLVFFTSLFGKKTRRFYH